MDAEDRNRDENLGALDQTLTRSTFLRRSAALGLALGGAGAAFDGMVRTAAAARILKVLHMGKRSSPRWSVASPDPVSSTATPSRPPLSRSILPNSSGKPEKADALAMALEAARAAAGLSAKAVERTLKPRRVIIRKFPSAWMISRKS